jgi:hypothetical protein
MIDEEDSSSQDDIVSKKIPYEQFEVENAYTDVGSTRKPQALVDPLERFKYKERVPNGSSHPVMRLDSLDEYSNVTNVAPQEPIEDSTQDSNLSKMIKMQELKKGGFLTTEDLAFLSKQHPLIAQ